MGGIVRAAVWIVILIASVATVAALAGAGALAAWWLLNRA